jgi:hypothetical protein
MTNSVINVLVVGTGYNADARKLIERLRRRGFVATSQPQGVPLLNS